MLIKGYDELKDAVRRIKRENKIKHGEIQIIFNDKKTDIIVSPRDRIDT